MGPTLVFYCLLLAFASGSKPPPTLVFILTDDLGWNSPGYHNPELCTPTLDSLANSGVRLERTYTYKYCSPTRSSILSGRYPYHFAATRCNLIPSTLPEGLDLGYQLLPAALARQGYSSHHIGKWHLGMHLPAYTPVGRGFNTSYGFLEGGEDHYTHKAGASGANCQIPGLSGVGGWDLWEQGGDAGFPGRPLLGLNGTLDGHGSGSDETYSANLWAERAESIIRAHGHSSDADAATPPPLFLYLALHNTHAPLEAPARLISTYNDTTGYEGERKKSIFAAMVSSVDETVGRVVDSLQKHGLWENTLLVWTTDNGSPIQVAGSNAPLRGGKGTNWEGGVRVPTFVAGGIVPDNQRGSVKTGLIHAADWFGVFAEAAGAKEGDVPDAGPAPPDSVPAVLRYIMGDAAESPRTEMILDHRMFNASSAVHGCAGQKYWSLPDEVALGSMIFQDGETMYKFTVGPEQFASWYGSFSPNATGAAPDLKATACLKSPCLFDIGNDPGEHNDLALDAKHAKALAYARKRFTDLASTHHPSVVPPAPLKESFCVALRKFEGYVAPYCRVEDKCT